MVEFEREVGILLIDVFVKIGTIDFRRQELKETERNYQNNIAIRKNE